MEKYREPYPWHRWLSDSYFRLHRRRQIGQHGYQPISYQEMADFANHVLDLKPSLKTLFFRAIEETDNAVLYDRWLKDSAELEKLKAENATKKPYSGKKRPKR